MAYSDPKMQIAWARKDRDKKSKKGLCTYGACGNPLEPGFRACAEHLSGRTCCRCKRERMTSCQKFCKQCKEDIESDGGCSRCYERPRDGLSTWCRTCLDYFKNKTKNRNNTMKEMGLCSCGCPFGRDGAQCQICLDKSNANQRELYKEHRYLGECTRCAEPEFKWGLCKRHVKETEGKYKTTAARRLDNRARAMHKLCHGHLVCQCLGCERKDSSHLCIDHIYGDPDNDYDLIETWLRLKLKRSGRRGSRVPTYRLADLILKMPEPWLRWRTLCHGCNQARDKQKDKRCPHEGHNH